MIEKAFVDSNIFLYASDKSESRKRSLARDLVHRLADGQQGVISSQVVNEYLLNVMKKFSLSPQEALIASAIFERFHFVRNDLGLSRLAVGIHERHGVSFWDGLIIAAAVTGGCETVYTEDLSHGHKIAGVRIVDPFA